jgi:predicted signal transduction protein with EAL and GGDEF domain
LISLSVGCAVFPEDGTDAEKLLAEADRRMYLEKQQHQGQKKPFDPRSGVIAGFSAVVP